MTSANNKVKTANRIDNYVALFENLEDGVMVDDFVKWFPSVTMEQVRGVLEHVARSVAA